MSDINPPHSPRWRYFSTAFVFRDEGAATLFLYGLATEGTARSEYDDISVRELVPEAVWKVRPSLPTRQTRTVPTTFDRANSRSVVGENLLQDGDFENSWSTQHAWQGVGDCAQTRKSSLPAKGISAGQVDAEGTGKALALAANIDSACVWQSVNVRPGLYRLSADYRSLRGEGGQICVFAPSLGRCLVRRSLNPVSDWKSQTTTLKIPIGVEAVQVYLYAPATNGQRNVSVFDHVHLGTLSRPVRDFLFASSNQLSKVPRINLDSATATSYSLSIEGATRPFLLTLNQTYDDGWQILQANGQRLQAAHWRVNGFSNGWLVRKPGNYELEIRFLPSLWVPAASLGSLALGIVMLALYSVYGKIRGTQA